MPQSLSQLWIHLIFSTKERYPFLKNPTLQKQVHNYLKTICHKQNCKTMAVGGIEDHVHLLVNLNKNISLATLVEEIKKSSSKWIKTLHTCDDTLSQFYWQRGYGAFSVSQSNLKTVAWYIENQPKHHQKYGFQDEFRKFLTQYIVPYEEKYVWD